MPYLKYINNEGLNIARGLVRNTSSVNKFGYNGAIGTSYQTVWTSSNLMPYVSIANNMVVTSSSSDDDVAGTGAQTITVEGLDEDYNPVSAVFNMNGTGNSTNTSISFLRAYRSSVTRVGSNDSNQGVISGSLSGNNIIHIIAGENQTLQANFTTAANTTAFVNDILISSGKENKTGLFRLVVRDNRTPNKPFLNKQLIELYRDSTVIEYPVPLKIPEKHDIEIQCKNLDASTLSASATFNLTVVAGEPDELDQ
tara:strand:- start:1408 stop:2169 length:762 start_codon:yes stop_codon:yes gene_type:complete